MFSSVGTGGKKGRQKERRLMKGFDIGVVKQAPSKSSQKSDVEAATKSPRTRWLKLATLANGKKQAKGWPYSERNSRKAAGGKRQARSRSMESVSSEVTSEAEATHNDTTSSDSSLSGAPGGSTEGAVTILISDDDMMTPRCDRATNTDTPALKWSKLTSKLGMLTLPSRLRMAFQDTPRDAEPPPPPVKKAKARRTVSAPAPPTHQLVMRTQAAAASIPSVSVSVANTGSSANSSSPSSPKTPPVPHIEEETTPEDEPQGEPVEPPVSPHKPSNGTLGLISTVYGIEPVNKEMRTGWI